MAKLDVIFNSTCPICAREVDLYRREAENTGAPVEFMGIDRASMRVPGMTADRAARRFHVVHDGQLLSGLPAFRALWMELPRWRWLARVTGWPVIRPTATLLYDGIAAPLLYALHRRRQRRQ